MTTIKATETTYRCIAQSRTTGETFSMGEITIIKSGDSKSEPLPKLKPDDTIEFSGMDAGFPDLIVQTTGREIHKCLKDMKKNRRLQLFLIIKRIQTVLEETKKKDFHKMFEEQGEDWNNLMDDVMLFYCARYCLFKTPMPVPA